MFLFKRQGITRKLHNFSDEQIQSKVYELWKARGFVGSSEQEDRQKAIELLQAEFLLPTKERQALDAFDDKDDREFALKVRQFRWEQFKTIISALGLGATVIAAISLFITYRQGEERLVTERFAKAVEQLGHTDISVRIGAIYALERIAKDSPKDHWTVMEVLTAYVREKSTLAQTRKTETIQNSEQSLPLTSPPIDVQSALTVIGRRDGSKDGAETTLNLSSTNLSGVVLSEANLRKASLYVSDLSDANLIGADLSEALLFSAKLKNAHLKQANLYKAYLVGADLQDANLQNANLSYANLNVANLIGANLFGANLSFAILVGARIHSDEQLKDAGLCKTLLPTDSLLSPDRDCKRMGIK